MTPFGYLLIAGLLVVLALLAWGVRDRQVDERPYDWKADGGP